MRTRPAVPDDAQVVAQLVAAGFESYRAWAPPGWTPPAAGEDAIRERLARADTWCLVAEADGRAIGHVVVEPAEGPRPPGTVRPGPRPLGGLAHLWHLFVLPEWWGRGIAAHLLSEALDEARRRGFARIRLFTPRDHARARAFYRREGFAQRGTSVLEIELGLPLVEYTRDLR